MVAAFLAVAGYMTGGAAALGALVAKGKPRLELSRAKHRSLTGHARMARRVASLIPFYDYGDARFFSCDDAPDAVAAQRRDAFMRLAHLYQTRFAKTAALTAEAASGISDLQFTGAYRVPFQFSRLVRQHLTAGSFLASSSGVTFTDLDGNVFYDVTGAYGVNLFGQDFYKACIDRGADRVRALGPVLGSYHPVVAENVARLQTISGLDEVSFHMSGTEAVMQAVRLARYHTGRSHLVRFSGAYHGWWGDVQPGIGNPVPAHETYHARRDVRAHPDGAAAAAEHRMRPGQSAPGAAPECRSACGYLAGGWRPAGGLRPGGLHGVAAATAHRVATSAASC